MRTTAMLVFFAGILFSTAVSGQGVFEKEKLPEVLSDWVDWVLYDVPNLDCPVVGDEPVCLWPGRLTLSLTDKGGTFLQDSFADMEMSLILPGSTLFWPQDVTVDGKKAPVIDQGNLPSVMLTKGAHRIEGRFLWDTFPEGIDVPPLSGMIDLTLNGKPAATKRDESGRLWLLAAAKSQDEEQLTLSVWRKLVDGVPLMMETRISIRASGKAREVTLDAVLPDGFAPLSVSGPLPARLDDAGNLKLQLRPGNHVMEILARSTNSPASIAIKSHKGPWPDQEIWVWQAEEKLRQVTLDGAPGIDTSRTDLPEEWRALPAFVIEKGTPLRLTTLRRGETEASPDQIHMKRELWMDLDQSGFTVRDEIGGTLNRSWRLDLEVDATLGRVSLEGQDQLITKNNAKRSGVELRKGDLSMTAEWKLNHSNGPLPAVGWSSDVTALSTTLNLPPGWTLLFTKGVDEVQNTWWDKWNLFGFFFVLITSIATAKLTRWWWGIVALVGLVLAHHEPEAPLVVWPSLLVALALVKVLKQEKLRIAALAIFIFTMIWLVLVLVPFDIYQIRNGLYPQAVLSDMSGTGFEDKPFAAVGGMESEPSAPPKGFESTADGDAEGKPEPASSLSDLSAVVRKGSDVPYEQKDRALDEQWRKSSNQQDPKAVVQTGMGIPNWRWNQWSLVWSGPVKRDHSISLYMISPKINLVLSFLRVLLLTLIGIILILEGRKVTKKTAPKGEDAPSGPLSAPSSSAAALGVVIAVLLASTSISAEEKSDTDGPAVPSSDLLNTLRDRLTIAPQCRPNCISVSRLDIVIQNDQAYVTAEVHAAASSSVMIPGPAENWTPKSVSLDGRSTSAVVRRDDGFLHARVEKGIHTLEFVGPMPAVGALVLSLGISPKYVTVTADGWTVDGLRDNNRAEGSLQFTRILTTSADGSQNSVDKSALPPWLEVTRQVNLGIPWTVITTVRRVSPTGTPVLVTVPLLPKESVTDPEIKVTGDGAVVSLSRDAESISWVSTLKEQEVVNFAAPTNVPWSEIWTVQCGTIWQCAFLGLLPVERKTDGVLKPIFKPWPAEKMSLKVNKPEGVEGTSITIDSAQLRMTPGTRLAKGVLTLNIRTSRGGEQKITLPDGATVQTLTLDGAARPFRQNGPQIVVPLKTGAQSIAIELQLEEGLGSRYVVPAVSVGGPAANVQVTVELPSDRWLIFIAGPSWGPAILFWGFLLAVLFAGFILGRYPLSPLKSHQWMLLFAGLTQVPVAVAVIIALWFILVARRGLHPFSRPLIFNLNQILLILMTVAAVICIVTAVYIGLAVQPDMQVAGMGCSDRNLVWYVDRIAGQIPSPYVISLPLLVWRIVMLAWALWLAANIVKWAPWAWRAFSLGGLWVSAATGDSNQIKKG
jgi:hypothetical protein